MESGLLLAMFVLGLALGWVLGSAPLKQKVLALESQLRLKCLRESELEMALDSEKSKAMGRD
jgi:uncharacterized membrane protein YciS (DUF1049 family)